MRRFRFVLIFTVVLLSLSAAVRPIAVAAQAACDPNAPVQLVSVGTDGLPTNTSYSTISDNGRYIGYVTDVDNNGVVSQEMQIRDRINCQTDTIPVSGVDGIAPNSMLIAPSASNDGRYVLFTVNTNGQTQFYQRDRVLGETELVSVRPSGDPFTCFAFRLDQSNDGRFVLMSELNSFCLGNNISGGLYVRDTFSNTTEHINVTMEGNSILDNASIASMSEDGNFVAFSSSSADLVAGDTNGFSDIFLRDRSAQQTTRINQAYDGGQANAFSGVGGNTTMTPDGRYVTFGSEASNLVPDDNNGFADTFVLDRQTNQMERLTMVVNGFEVNSHPHSISSDGRFVVVDDFDHLQIIDRQTGAAYDPLSHHAINPSGTSNIAWFEMSKDGRYIAYVEWNTPVGTQPQQGRAYVAEWQRLFLPPAAPTPTAPITAISETQPTFTWNTVQDGAWYQLWVTGADGHVIDQWYDAWNICDESTCSVTPELNLPTGQYQWWLQAWSPYSGYGEWNNGAFFTVNVPPAAPTPTAPLGVIEGNQATFTWNTVSGAAWYQLWVSDANGHVLDQWYDGFYVCTGGICSVTPPITLEGGLHHYWVQVWSPYGGYSEWSTETFFAVTPSTPTPLAPIGTAGQELAFQWTRVSGGAWYYLWLSNDAGHVFDSWFEAGLVCGESVCATELMQLPAGNYRWWIQAWNPDGGYSAWSGQTDFSIPSASPPVESPPEVVPPEITPEATNEG